MVPGCTTRKSVYCDGSSAPTAFRRGSGSITVTTRQRSRPLLSRRSLRSIKPRSSDSAAVAVPVEAAYNRKHPTQVSDRFAPPAVQHSTMFHTTHPTPSAIPSHRITQRTMFPVRNSESSSASTRPPSNGSAGSRLTSKMDTFAMKSSCPAYLSSTPMRVSVRAIQHSSSVSTGPASRINSRFTGGSDASSSRRMSAPSGVNSMDAGGQPSSAAAAPWAHSCSNTDAMPTSNHLPYPSSTA